MAAPNYDAMAEEDGEDTADTEDEMPADDPADDDEFMMEAEAAGFTGEKAKAFWRAVARCVELTKDGAAMPMDDAEEPLV